MIHKTIRKVAFYFVLLVVAATVFSASIWAQGLSSGTVAGTVLDPNNAAVPNANVTIANPVTGYKRTVTSGADGTFRFDNVPPNSYQLSVSASGFNVATKSLDVRSSVPMNIQVPLTVGGASVNVTVSTVSATDVLENEPSTHVDVDKSLMDRLPARDPGSGLSTAVTLAAPGVAADSNGGYHPLGDHFESNILCLLAQRGQALAKHVATIPVGNTNRYFQTFLAGCDPDDLNLAFGLPNRTCQGSRYFSSRATVARIATLPSGANFRTRGAQSRRPSPPPGRAR